MKRSLLAASAAALSRVPEPWSLELAVAGPRHDERGDITAVVAGTGLTGGGQIGSVALSRVCVRRTGRRAH